MKEDSLSAIKEKAALRDKSSDVMEKQVQLQETEKIQYKNTHKKAFFNRRRKESTRLGVKSEVAKSAIADKLARFKKGIDKKQIR